MMVPVTADDAAMRRVLAQAENRVDQFAGKLDGSLRRVDGAFDRLGRSASGAATAVVALAGVRIGSGLADSLSDAAKSAMAFQTAMAQVGTLLKGADTSRYAAQVKDLSRQFGQLPTDQAKALYEIISAGANSAANAIGVLTEANKLAIGGVTDVQTAADGLTSVLNSYGAAVGSVTDISDAFFASAAAGKTNIKELATYVGQVAPIAAQTGVSFDELMASAAALTANGIKTSTAMDGMRSVIAAVLKPSQEATSAARALGLEFNAGALKAKGFAGFLQDVADKTGGSSDSLALLFGGVEALLPVMALASRESTAFADAQKELHDKAGATEAAYRRIAETTQQTADRVKAAAAIYRVELGDRLLSAVQPAMSGLANNFDAVTGAAETAALALGAVFVARGVGPAVQAAGQFATAQAAMRGELVANTGHLLAKEAALRAGAAATVEAATADLAAAKAAQTKARSDLAARAAQMENAVAVDGAIGKTARLIQAEEALTAARATRATRAAADARVAETTVALTMAQDAQASAIARTGLAATVASRGMAVLSGAMALVGGPVGAALLAGAAAVAVFSSGMTASEKATRLHGEAMRDFDAAFDRSTGKVKTMTEAVAALRRQNLEAARDAALAAVKQEETYARAGSFKIDRAAYESGLSKADAAKVFAPARDLQQQFLAGTIGAEELFAAIDKLARQDERLKPLAKAFSEWAAPLAKAKQEVKESEAGLALLNGTADDAAKAVLGIGSNAATAATGFQTMGGEVAGLTAKLADLAAKAKLLEVPAGYQRRLAELVGPEPANGDAKDLALWRKKRDAADATLRPIVGLETRDQTAELERQANGQRLLAGAVSDAAKAQAQNRVELAKVALEYPGLGAETAKTLLTTKDFGAVLKTLPLDLQQRWAVLQSSSQAQLAGAAAQGTVQLTLQTEAQARLAAAAGKGEAATRRATIENQVAAAAVHGLAAATRTNLEAQEKSTQQQLRSESSQPILAHIENQKALVAAYAKGPAAVQAAEVAEKAHTLALKEGEEGTAKYAEAKAHYIALLEEEARGAAAVAAGPLLQQQRDQLALGQKQILLIGASAEQRAVELARTQALIDLRAKNIDSASKEGQTYLANAEALAKQGLELERTNAAYDELAKFGERGMDAVLDKLVAAGKSTMSWADAVSAVGVEFQQLAMKMALINPIKNAVLGTNLPTLFDFGSIGGASGGGGGISAEGTLLSNGSSMLQNQGLSWGMSKLGVSPTSMLDSFGTNYLGIAPTLASSGYVAPTVTLANGSVVQASSAVQASQLANLAETSSAFAGSAGGGAGGIAGSGVGLGTAAMGVVGAAGAGYMVGGYLGTKTNSKAVGAAGGAAAGAMYGTMILPGWGTAIGAIVGAIAGMVGTQKKSSGPNGESVLAASDKGITVSRNMTDNDGDDSYTKQLGDTASTALNALIGVVGDKFTPNKGGEFGSVRWAANTDKYTSRVGGIDQSFDDADQAMQDFLRRTLQLYAGTGELAGVNADVKKALSTSTAKNSEDLATDLAFADGFRSQFDAMNASLNPTNNQLKVFTDNAKALGEQIKTNITDWRSKASELGLATETELTEAARRGITAMMGLGPAIAPLVGMPAVTEQARIEFEAFRPALVGLGYSATEVADLAVRYTAKAKDAYNDSAALLQRQGAVSVAALTNSFARLSTADQFRAAGASKDTVTAPAFAALAGTLDSMAATAQRGALTVADVNWQMGALNKTLYDGVLTVEQYGSAVSLVTGAFQASQQVLSTLRQGWASIQAITEPNRKQTAADVLNGAMVNGGAEGVAAFSERLQGLFTAIHAGTASFEELGATYRQLVPLFQSGVLTGDQFNTVIGAMAETWKTAKTTAAATAAYQSDLNARMHTAVGRLRTAGLLTLDQQQAKELADAQDNGRDTAGLLMIQAAERAAQAFTLAQQDVTEWYDRQITAQQDIVTALQDGAVKVAQFARQFADARGALREGEDSPLAPGVKMAEAEARFRTAYATATSTTATETETEAARQLLLQLGPQLVAMEKAASGQTASALFNLVDSVFRELGDATALGVDTADRQLETAQNTLKELQKARTDAANLGQRQLGSLTDLTSVMNQSYAVWQAALVPLQGLTGTTSGATLAQMTTGLTAGSLPAVMTWARAQGAGTVQQVLQAADAQLGWANNPYRYTSPAELQPVGQYMSGDDFLGVMRSIGFTGDVGAANSWIAAYGKAGVYEAAVRAWAHDHGVPGFETGGVIGNGAFGRDSVLARFAGGGTVMLAGGEGVLTAGATSAIGSDAVAYINRHHALPALDVAPPSPTIAFRRPDLSTGGGAGVAELVAAVEGLRAEVRAIGDADRTQRARIGGDAAALLERIESTTADLSKKLANTRRAA